MCIGGLEMNAPEAVSAGTILECVGQGWVEVDTAIIIIDGRQHQVEGGGYRAGAPSRPVPEGVALEPPNFWSARSDLEPVANEQEVV